MLQRGYLDTIYRIYLTIGNLTRRQTGERLELTRNEAFFAAQKAADDRRLLPPQFRHGDTSQQNNSSEDESSNADEFSEYERPLFFLHPGKCR